MHAEDKTIIFQNGEWLQINNAGTNMYSQTLHYGNGVFEGIRCYETPIGTQIFKGYNHFERLHHGCEVMGISLPYSVDELVSITYELLDRNNFKNAYIRPLVYLGTDMALRTPRKTNIMISAWKWGPYLGNKLLRVMTSSFERPNPKSIIVDAKISGHYVTSILAVNEAKARGYDEALLLDMNGFVSEGPGANFFYEKDGVLYTAPKGHILPGITRSTIIQLAKELDIPVKELHFNTEHVEGSDGAFFTGTAAEVVGLKSLNDVPFNMPWEETHGYKLKQAYRSLVKSTQSIITDVV